VVFHSFAPAAAHTILKGKADRRQAMGNIRPWIMAIAGALALGGAHAELLIGQTVGVTGTVAATVKESMLGAQLYIDEVNAKGGVRGEKIEILTLDDHFEVPKTVENAKTLIEEKNVLALFMSRGTPNTEAMLPLLQQHNVALIAPSTGAMVLHEPVKKQVFNVRAPYQREAEKAVTHLATIGMSRIAVVHVDDSFGTDALVGAEKGFAKAKLKPVVVLKADRLKPDYGAIVPQIQAAQAQAVVWVGSGTAVADGIKALRKAGSAAQVVTLSNNASGGFIKLLGDASNGVIVTQVFPYERTRGFSMVGEVAELAKAKGIEQVSPAMLEGFAGAKVLVEALRRAGPKPTREKLIAALEGMRKYDLGGLQIAYSTKSHTGLDFADLSIIGPDGRFRR
jgi:ABC-type branched-subunit amino acid transport system substrate-binding protein